MENSIAAILDLLFPPRCIFCREVVPSGGKVCKKCEEEIPYIDSVKYMNVRETGKTISCTVPYPYEGQVRQSILRFKFQNQKQFADFYAEKMAAQVQKSYAGVRFDAVTCVPISSKRRKTRGYNQSELIATKIAKIVGLPYQDYLLKSVDNKEQHKLSEKERRKNVQGVYKIRDKEEITGKRILLIDDIVTTGATLCECAWVLLKSGAEDVACAAIAEVR